ncbi:MAG: dihydroorotate dehydrogenase [Muribaculaceae bacterium]|nr:dihydroorotate dehydrogenase [Muribaculaceae bacterium]
MVDLSVDLGNGLRMKNPVMLASGTCGYGEELADFIDLSSLGGISVKGTTLHARQGNASPRMVETPSGMLNAVGLQNKGVDYFVENIYPRIASLDTSLVVNVSGSSVDDYVAVCDRLRPLDRIAAVEINISCPNVKQGGMSFGTDPSMAAAVVVAARQIWSRHLMVKLTPNVTDITLIARAVEEAGADSVSLTNTFLGMAIDVERQRPYLSTITGGLSGAAIRPIAVRMVWQASQAVRIPVVGLGGITCGRDAVEFLLAGASAVQIGTANFIDPTTSVKAIAYIEDYMERHNMADMSAITGAMKTP